jgi:hypothetical protein
MRKLWPTRARDILFLRKDCPGFAVTIASLQFDRNNSQTVRIR